MNKIVAIVLLLLGLTRCQLQCPPGCLTCTIDLKCQSCDTDFQLNDLGICTFYPPIKNCLIYDSKSTIDQSFCFNCSQGFLAQGRVCSRMKPFCVQTSSLDICERCLDGYKVVDRDKCYQSDISNCKKGSLPRQDYCQRFERQSCKKPNQQETSCNQCQNGYQNINGVCLMVRNKQPCPSNSCNCLKYLFNQICYDIHIRNCLRTIDNVYCQLCSDEQISVSGKCFDPVKVSDINCNVVDLRNRNLCTGCNFEYFLDSNFICVKEFGYCSDRQCTAQMCPKIFNFFEGSCLFNDPLCTVYDRKMQQCTKCSEGYSLNSNKVCQKTEKCKQKQSNGCGACFFGFQRNPVTRDCFQLPKNCIQYDFQTDRCKNCSSQTQFQSSSSYKCVFRTLNCLTYNKYGNCQTCENGMVEFYRQCYLRAQNCVDYKKYDQSKCLQCASGWHLDKKTELCFINQIGCNAYEEKSFCNLCRSQFFLKEGICRPKDISCLQTDLNGYCVRCNNGNLPTGKGCTIYDAFCINYVNTSLTCNKTYNSFQFVNYQTSSSFQDFVREAETRLKSTNGGQLGGSSGAGADLNGGGYFLFNSQGIGSFYQNGIINVLPQTNIRSSRIATYNIRGTILSCNAPFTLQKNNCVLAKSNCLSYSQYGICQTCLSAFDMNLNGDCVLRSLLTCSQVAINNSCLNAAFNYRLINGQAYYGLNNITQSLGDGQIMSVNQGYFLWKQYNIAWLLDYNCKSQSKPGYCLQCQQHFTTINGKCVIYRQNCKNYSLHGKCNSCVSGFIRLTDNCVRQKCSESQFNTNSQRCKSCPTPLQYQMGLCYAKKRQNCITYNNQDQCVVCTQNYYLENKNCKKFPIDNCQKVNPTSNACNQCKGGYLLASANLCSKRVENCFTYNALNGSCQQCTNNYFLAEFGKTCLKRPLLCQDVDKAGSCTKCGRNSIPYTQDSRIICIYNVDNCTMYDTSGKCINCTERFNLYRNRCRLFIRYCVIPDLSNSRCTRCTQGYILTLEGKCVRIIPFCQAYNISGVCQNCLQGYVLLKNGYQCRIKIPNCRIYNQKNCQQCVQGYISIGGDYCRKSIQNCQIYFVDTCTRCQTGYRVLDNGTKCGKIIPNCKIYLSQNKCQQCITGYRPIGSKSSCSPVIPQCFIYHIVGTCLLCNNGSVLNKDKTQCNNIPHCLVKRAEGCYKCQPGYTLVNNACISNCLRPQQQQNCTKCKSNLVLKNGICIQAIQCECLFSTSNCEYYHIMNGSCGKCQQNFELADQKCVRSVPNCSDYNVGGCTACSLGFYLENNACLPNPMNCYQYSTQCLKCVSPYQLKGGSCQPSIAFCKTVNKQNLCTQCYPTYHLQSQKCQKNPPFCSKVSQQFSCLQCHYGYVLLSQKCQATTRSDINCQQFNSTNLTCQKCEAQYYRNSFGICLYLDPNCVHNFAGICLRCKKSFVVRDGKCIKVQIQKIVQNVYCPSDFTYLQGKCVPSQLFVVQFFFSIGGTTNTSINGNIFQLSHNIQHNQIRMVSTQILKLYSINFAINDQQKITRYRLQYRNPMSNNFECFKNNCNSLTYQYVTLDFPLITKEVRINIDERKGNGNFPIKVSFKL